uniref:Serine hydrolase domain-containing protein n=1 Tax=Alexandrium monilatum TaxID=311494 RepID=A0A7S4T1T7_9DINO|mmetsp:Transcript_78489/g.233872  ORF Transcript_78489/g.233872 Transcript_78489/m.233872 type:complete len:540 (+) Transcript_78489:100-1719(+)
MDFDDLEECEAAAGPTAEEQREEMVAQAVPEAQVFPLPKGRCFGKDNKMKMLFLHGGGSNQRIAQMQVMNVFKEMPDNRQTYEWTHWIGPHKVPLGWNGDYSLQPFGPEFYVYFERLPFANCQWESWDGIDKSLEDFKLHLKENGPYDGACGFDMGGEFLVHVARKAQEGDPDFKGCFRFLILFTTGSSKHLSPLGGQRPKSPLRIPAVLSWCNGDTNHTYMWYEETLLFFHKDYREVITHLDGHMPPRILKETSQHERLSRFLDIMRRGGKFTPSDHEDNHWNANLWLPLKRVEPTKQTGTKRLLVVPDPMGEHDFPGRIDHMKELKLDGKLIEVEAKPFIVGGSPPALVEAMQLKLKVCTATHEAFAAAAGSAFEVEAVSYTDGQKQFNWHCKPAQVPSPMLNPEDIIDDEGMESVSRMWAGQLLEKFSMDEEDQIGIVGLGTGAFVALAIAKYCIKERKHTPAGLWVANAPTRLPWCTTAQPGALLDCPVRFLTYETSTYGPGWRYEVSTCGPFSQATFKDLDALVKLVVDDFKAL